MNFEQSKDAPFARLQSEEFRKNVREGFADLLEDRATDPLREKASASLAAMAAQVRLGEKIARTPAALEIFRGVFFGEGPLNELGITHVEIDSLEKVFFES